MVGGYINSACVCVRACVRTCVRASRARLQERIHALRLPASGVCQHSLTCDHIAFLPASTFPSPSVCLCPISVFLSFMTLVMAYRAQPGHSRKYPHLKVLNLLTPAKNLFSLSGDIYRFLGLGPTVFGWPWFCTLQPDCIRLWVLY